MSKYIYALDSSGNRIHISDAKRGDNGYTCCYCHNKMIARKGTVRAPHFAHAADCVCDDWYGNKGEWHRHMQDLFPKDAQEVILESDGERHIADVCLSKPNGQRLVIEFQHSPMSREEFVKRTLFWKSNNTDLIWVFDVRKCDIRLLPDADMYRWFRPFSCLKYCWKKITSIPVIFYMQPKTNAYWCAYKNSFSRKGYSVVLSDGQETDRPFFLLDSFGNDLVTYANTEYGSTYVNLNGYQLLTSRGGGQKMPDEESFLKYVKDRMFMYCNTVFSEYEYDTWIKFENIDQYCKQKPDINYLLNHYYGNEWRRLIIYVDDQKLCFAKDFSEDGQRISKLLISKYGADRVKIIGEEGKVWQNLHTCKNVSESERRNEI